MRVHLMREPGRGDPIAHAIDVLLQVRFSIDMFEDDGISDLASPKRIAYLRSLKDHVSSAIQQLEGVRV